MEHQRILRLEEKIENRFSASPVPIYTLGDERYELQNPLNITLEQRREDEFIACLYDIDLYGYGDSAPEAIDDLKLAMVNQFDYLSEHEKTIELSDPLEKQLQFLRKILVSRDA